MCGLPDVGVFQRPYFSKYLLLKPLASQAFCFICCLHHPDCCPLPQGANIFAFKFFHQTLPREPVQPWGSSKARETRTTTWPDPSESHQAGQTQNQNFLKIRFISFPQVPTSAPAIWDVFFMATTELGSWGWEVSKLKFHSTLALTSEAQLVGCHLAQQKVHWFNSWSGHMLEAAHLFLSYIDVSLHLLLPHLPSL